MNALALAPGRVRSSRWRRAFRWTVVALLLVALALAGLFAARALAIWSARRAGQTSGAVDAVSR